MNNAFSCPVCKKKQPIKKLPTLSNFSEWNCNCCGTKIKPKKLSSLAAVAGFFSSSLPALFMFFVIDSSFVEGILVGVLSGIVAYIIALAYFFNTVELEEV